jgi:hypothetical protein
MKYKYLNQTSIFMATQWKPNVETRWIFLFFSSLLAIEKPFNIHFQVFILCFIIISPVCKNMAELQSVTGTMLLSFGPTFQWPFSKVLRNGWIPHFLPYSAFTLFQLSCILNPPALTCHECLWSWILRRIGLASRKHPSSFKRSWQLHWVSCRDG